VRRRLAPCGGAGPSAPPAADAEAIAEEKKKRKKEDAKIFFEQKKKQKQEEKEKRDAAIARGELPPEPEKPKAAPLKEPPLLFPHAQALHSTFWDPSADPDALRAVVQELLAARRQLAAETEEISKRDDIAQPARRKALLKVIADRLQCVRGGAPMAQLAGDPTIQVLRKGVTRSFKDFAQKHPDWFTYAEENTNGKFMQMVYLSDGYHTTPINEVTLKQRTERLLFKIGTILKATDSGGLPVSALGADPAVRDLRKGVAAGLKQFLQKHAGHFRLEDADATSEKGEPMKVLTCHLVEMPPEPPPPPEPEPGAEEAADGTQWVAAQAALEWPGARAQDAWASQGQWGSWVGVGGNGDAALDAAGKQAAVALASMGAAVQAGAKGKGKGAPGLPAEGPKILAAKKVMAPMAVGAQRPMKGAWA